MLPVGLNPPASVAVSVAVAGGDSEDGETDVVTVGLAGLTTKVSPDAPHAVVTGLLAIELLV